MIEEYEVEEILKQPYNADDINPEPAEPDYDRDRLALARTMWGEARGEGPDGMMLVKNTIENRKNSGGKYNWPETSYEVAHQPYQFSVWNPNDPNRPKLLALDENSSDPQFQQALELATKPLPEHLEQFKDADHYHTTKVQPSWSKSPKMRKLGKHGNHIFYSTKPGTGITPAANLKGGFN
jgi:N-acetylmuramoyl-L-alanine amidase